MSGSSQLFRHAAARRSWTSGVRTPLQASFRPSPAHAAFLRRDARDLPSHVPALAAALARRSISTETATSGPGASVPPPGFDPGKAKRPLRKEKEAKRSSAESAAAVRDSVSDATRASAADQQSLTQLATERSAEEQKLEAKKEEKKKLTIMQKIKKELVHYWDGTKLLATEVRISIRLALKMAAGYELSRRENRQLQRTVQDLGRLVPFSVFLIVPFAELLLPVALRLFPNLLPSTYEGQKSKDAKATNLRATRKEVSNFLRDTLKETGLPVSSANAQRDDFIEFFRKVRATGESPTPADVIKVCKIFKDDLTLDNLSRPQLVGMTRYMNLNTFGTDLVLRYQIRHRMRQIKRDDRAISFEGVESLSVPELQTACASRGLRTHGVSPGRLRDDLQMWLDLRLKYGVPSTLLVLSNAFMYAQGKEAEMGSQIDALQAVLSSIPEELFHEIELEVHNAEGAATNRQRLEVLREQQELIEEENEQDAEGGAGRATPRDDEDIDEKEDRQLREGEAATDGAEGEAREQKEEKEREKEGTEKEEKEKERERRV
ncbi:MAG: hypothetical protein M1832_001837 [Thelocarpon impressellum]|nr:MAG: hypothetical protein M1832_001837 [Thelocarpon impressellum]